MDNRIKVIVRTEKQFTNLNQSAIDFLKGRKGNGMLNVFVKHTTCGVKIIENELLLLADINNHLSMLAPKDGKYLHDKIEIRDAPVNERINGYSHIQQLYFPSSINVPVEDGEMLIGKWQTIFLIEFDPIRDREVIFSYIPMD